MSTGTGVGVKTTPPLRILNAAPQPSYSHCCDSCSHFTPKTTDEGVCALYGPLPPFMGCKRWEAKN